MNFALSLAGRRRGGGGRLAVVLFQTERPPMEGIQRGYRGVAMEVVYNPRIVADELAANKVPASLPRLAGFGSQGQRRLQKRASAG